MTLNYNNYKRVARPPTWWTPNLVADDFTDFDFITTERMPTWQPIRNGRVCDSVGQDGMQMPDRCEERVVWVQEGARVQPNWGVVWFQPYYDNTPEGLVGKFGKAKLDGMFKYEGPGKPTHMYTTHLPGSGVYAGTRSVFQAM
jgi:hypothetical protein